MNSKKSYVRYSTKTVTVTKSVSYVSNSSNDSRKLSPVTQSSYGEIPKITFPKASRQAGTSFEMNQSSRSKGCSCTTFRPNNTVVKNNSSSSNSSSFLNVSQRKPRANSTGSIRNNAPSMINFNDTVVANEPTGRWYSLNQGSPTKCSTSNISWSNYNC